MCGKEHDRTRSKYCSKECGKKIFSTERVRNKISKGRKRFLKENPDKHPWRNKDKFKSEPCKRFKEFLINNDILFIDEWMPLEDKFYSIDIAFPDKMIGIEINGNQHYNVDGSLREYYQNRHDLIESVGWKLYEIHYSRCFSNESISEVVSNISIGIQEDYTKYFEKKQEKELERKKKKPLERGQKLKIKNDKKWEPYKEKILNSNIEFKKYGWVSKVSEILGIQPQKVKRWMLRNMEEFYKKECYKRKPPAPPRVF